MKTAHFTPGDYVTSRWAGGTTVQLAIAPAGALYAGRDFLWRVSSAVAETDESDYTALPDYQRWLCVFDRPIRLCHDGGEAVTLAPWETYCFDGAAATHAYGRCTDFNLMLRKGRAQGDLRAVRLSGRQALAPEGADTAVLYCVEGGGVLGETPLKEKETLLLWEIAPGETLLLEGSGKFMLARIKQV